MPTLFKIILTLSTSLLVNISVFANDIVIGNKIQIHSKILGENRELLISLPESYNDSIYFPASYPVLYLLDPQTHFHSMVAVREALTGGYYNNMPELIIVSIVNTDRSRDLTPTNGFVIHSGKKIHETSGGAGQFLSFINDELKPYIDSNYRTNGYTLLTGHSFGGLFTLYALQTKPESFNAYIVHDPSIWWDNKTIYTSGLSNWSKLDMSGRYLYLSKAYDFEKEADRLQHSQTIQDFHDNILNTQTGNGLQYKFEYFEKEDHGTIFLPATYNSVRYIFDGICLPVKEIPDKPELIEEHYQRLSDRLNFPFLPPEHLVDKIANYCMLREQYDSARYLLEKNIENYPLSWHAYYSLGKVYIELNKAEQAHQMFEKAKELNHSILIPDTNM